MVGVLALQGSFAPHMERIRALGRPCLEVRAPEDLKRIDRLIIPGGESTVMARLLERTGLREPLERRLDKGMPVFGTCAGMILLSSALEGPGPRPLARMDIRIRRNAYGRQIASFETPLPWRGKRIPALFIRAPRAELLSGRPEVLIRHDGDPVLIRQGACLAASFHPELEDGAEIHRYFLEETG